VLLLSPRGRPFGQADARRLADGPGVVLLCGRYEGVDERVLEAHRLEEISLGDFVLSGGEIAALAVLDACVRLLPGVMGEVESLREESFEDGLLEYPHYTRPAAWTGPDGVERTVPEILLSGHHGKIAAWRQTMRERVTRERRPDLWARRADR
jgi:tRNA (guanine37-N1)-methyltransferase